MGVCYCSLAGTKACETCPNNGNSIRFAPISWPQNVQEYGDDTYQRGLSEGRKQGLREAVEIAKHIDILVGSVLDAEAIVEAIEDVIEKEGK